MTSTQRLHEASVLSLKHASLAGVLAVECQVVASSPCVCLQRSHDRRCRGAQRRYLKALYDAAPHAGATFFAARQVRCVVLAACSTRDKPRRRQRRAPYRVWLAVSEQGIALSERSGSAHKVLFEAKLSEIVTWTNTAVSRSARRRRRRH